MNDQYLLILFYSASGSVKNLAHAIADGAEASGMPTKLGLFPGYHLTQKQLSLKSLLRVKSIAQKKSSNIVQALPWLAHKIWFHGSPNEAFS